MSQPPGSIDGTLRVTEQGEMMQALFGLPDIALRTMEVYTSGDARGVADAGGAAPRRVARAHGPPARRARQALIAPSSTSDPRFLDYFHAATPEAELATMNIGSRPGAPRRRTPSGVEEPARDPVAVRVDADAAAARRVARRRGGARRRDRARRARRSCGTMYREWPYFQSAIDLIEMVLAKSRCADRRRVRSPAGARPTCSRSARAARAARPRPSAACSRSPATRELLESNPVLRRSIDVRNPYVDPINLVQIELLRSRPQRQRGVGTRARRCW